MFGQVAASARAFLDWFKTDFGISTFFFLLDFLVVVLLLPEVLTWRARKRWSSMARNLLYDSLTTIEGLSGDANALYELLNPVLDNFPKIKPTAPPDSTLLTQLRGSSRSALFVIDIYKSNFSLTNISLQSFPTDIETLTGFVRSVIALETSFRILEARSDWDTIWEAWLSLEHEVRKNFPRHRAAVQKALGRKEFQ